MTIQRANEIQARFEELDRTYPDKSTEWLIAMTAEKMQCETNDVCEALFKADSKK
jgi:hypothetical protein